MIDGHTHLVIGASVRETWGCELRLLLGAEAGQLLAAVAGAAGGSLESWSARQVSHQPDRSTTVQYRARLALPNDAIVSETFVATTGQRVPETGAAVFDNGQTRVAVWRWPNDPFLPGLAPALSQGKVAALLDDIGVDGSSVRLRTRAYRPGRRAVVEATGRRGRLFLKVVPPGKAKPLHELHRLLSSKVPVPDSLGWTSDGVVVLAGLPGRTLRDVLRSSGQLPPPPEQVTAVLDRLPADLANRPPRPDLIASAATHAEVIAATVPGTSGLLDDLVGRFRSSRSGTRQVTAVHGDLYEKQLLVDRGRLVGLLDVDTTGAGCRVDDYANFIAHLSVLALDSDRPRHVRRYGASLLAHAERHHEPDELRPCIAAAIVGLATGPFRVLEPRWEQNTLSRLRLADHWMAGVRST
jgi:hypothetical protein